MPPLRGYKLLPGSARRYQTPSGKTISRREYDNRRARKAGFANRYQVEKFRREMAGSRWFGDIYQHTGRSPTWDTYADWREVRQRRARIAARRAARGLPPGTHSETDSDDPELVAPEGPLARLLDAAGKRFITGRPVGAS